MHYEVTGSGRPVVLLHAGIADGRMWEPQWRSYAARYRLLRCDLAGFGHTPIEQGPLQYARDVAAMLDDVGITHAALIGCSMGGRVALEVAVARPELVSALVLVAAGLPGHDWSEEIRASWAAEEAAIERGDLDAATELDVRLWVDGPRRTPGDVDPEVRLAVAEMQRRALELQVPHWATVDEELLAPDLPERLSEIEAPTLVLVGEEDVDDMQAIARRLAAEIPGAQHATIPGSAHLPSLEVPEAFDALVLGFLGDVL
jgi:3-oxoadipate enol-lactonase